MNLKEVCRRSFNFTKLLYDGPSSMGHKLPLIKELFGFWVNKRVMSRLGSHRQLK